MTSLTDTDWGPQESRTVSWHDPAKPAEVGLAIGGGGTSPATIARR